MTVIIVVEYLSVQAREPSRAGSRAYIEPSRASSSSSRSDRAEPGLARYSTEPGSARLVSSPISNRASELSDSLDYDLTIDTIIVYYDFK
jgi:hypothetical protein